VDIETWMWKNHKIAGTEPSKLRLPTACVVQHRDVDRFLEMFDQYRKVKEIAWGGTTSALKLAVRNYSRIVSNPSPWGL
jgi:hypothetical protein